MRVLFVLLAVFLLALPVLAQGEEPADPAFELLLVMAASVAGFVEVVKPLLESLRDRLGYSEEVHTLTVRLVAIAASFALVFLTDVDANVLEAFGITVDATPLAARIVTALAIGFGSAVLWSGYRLFKLLPEKR